MKISNIRIVSELVFTSCNGDEMMNAYELARKKNSEEKKRAGEGGTMWITMNDDKVHRTSNRNLMYNHGKRHQSFTACIVAYDYKATYPTVGLSRRESMKILKRAGLRSPTKVETFLLACRTIVSGEVREVGRKNNDRRIMAPVPINPEQPTYYYFGNGCDGKGDFQEWSYCSNDEGSFNFEKGGDLYFWHNAGSLQRYCFPLLLGIKQ